jgi:hypothetical protein
VPDDVNHPMGVLDIGGDLQSRKTTMPSDTAAPQPKPPRSPAIYRLVIALPLLMLMYFVASGRLAAYWHLFASAGQNGFDDRAFAQAFVTGILWPVSVTPLLLAAWELGKRQTAARRTGFELFVGLKDVFKIAFWGTPAWESVNRQQALDRPPRDRRLFAVIYASIIAIGVPSFFISFVPWPRTPGVIVWVIVAGLLMAGAVYCQQRAAAYLRDEPPRWDFFGQWRTLNPDRYDDAGRVFVRWQRALSIALPIWWLFVGAAVLFR